MIAISNAIHSSRSDRVVVSGEVIPTKQNIDHRAMFLLPFDSTRFRSRSSPKQKSRQRAAPERDGMKCENIDGTQGQPKTMCNKTNTFVQCIVCSDRSSQRNHLLLSFRSQRTTHTLHFTGLSGPPAVHDVFSPRNARPSAVCVRRAPFGESKKSCVTLGARQRNASNANVRVERRSG